MGFLRRNEILNLRGAAHAAILVLCTFLSFIDGNVAVPGPDLSSLPSSQPEMTEAAARLHNLGKWLEHVHSTSDPEDEPWFDETFQADESLQHKDPQDHKDKFKPKRTIVVAKDGSGHFTTIQAGLDDIPTINKERVLIKVKAGIYREKLKISSKKQYITIEGERPLHHGSGLRTVITYNATAADLDKHGKPLRTFGSASFAVNAKNFIAKYITFKNTAPQPVPGAVGGQAVAVRVSADRAAFYGCRFYGDQDTLYDHKGRHFFKDCYAEGTVDFVFGNGRSLYESCHLNALSNDGTPGTLTAQKRNASSIDTGFSFLHSIVTGYGSVYLGRAWGNDSRVVFANTFMTKVVLPVGWDDWGIPAREKSVFYAEYNCTGPGANLTERVKWAQQLTFEQAEPFLSIRYINGKKWLQNPKSLEKEERRAIAVEEAAAGRKGPDSTHKKSTSPQPPLGESSYNKHGPDPQSQQQHWATTSNHGSLQVALDSGSEEENTTPVQIPSPWLFQSLH